MVIISHRVAVGIIVFMWEDCKCGVAIINVKHLAQCLTHNENSIVLTIFISICIYKKKQNSHNIYTCCLIYASVESDL